MEPSRGLQLQLSGIWRHRELLYFLTWRDVKVRYKQTLIGAAWAVLQPVALTLAFVVVFGRLVRLPTDGLPYPLFFYAALVPWTFFANGVNSATNSLVNNQTLITRVFFPRVILPLASTLAGLIDLTLALLLLIGMALTYGRLASTAVLLPVFFLIALLAVCAVGVWSAALNARYRDLRHAVPVLLQLGFFASPVVYPSSVVPARWRAIYSANPMAGVIDGFRWALTGEGSPPGPMLAASVGIVVVVLATGMMYFRRTEGTIADVV